MQDRNAGDGGRRVTLWSMEHGSHETIWSREDPSEPPVMFIDMFTTLSHLMQQTPYGRRLCEITTAPIPAEKHAILLEKVSISPVWFELTLIAGACVQRGDEGSCEGHDNSLRAPCTGKSCCRAVQECECRDDIITALTGWYRSRIRCVASPRRTGCPWLWCVG